MTGERRTEEEEGGRETGLALAHAAWVQINASGNGCRDIGSGGASSLSPLSSRLRMAAIATAGTEGKKSIGLLKPKRPLQRSRVARENPSPRLASSKRCRRHGRNSPIAYSETGCLSSSLPLSLGLRAKKQGLDKGSTAVGVKRALAAIWSTNMWFGILYPHSCMPCHLCR